MTNIAIIPARGGSKRIPRKNIKNFLGKPIIAYSIGTALESGIFSEVMVSTDDDEIAETAKRYGAKIPFKRTAKNSDEFATTHDVMKEVIHTYGNLGQTFDYACCIYATAPFTTKELLKKAYDTITTHQYDLVLPIAPYSYPIQRSFIINESKELEYAFPENINKRSQDLTKHFHDAGQFYFFKVIDYLARNKLIGDRMHGIELNDIQVQDIDNEHDWQIAEMKYKLLFDL